MELKDLIRRQATDIYNFKMELLQKHNELVEAQGMILGLKSRIEILQEEILRIKKDNAEYILKKESENRR